MQPRRGTPGTRKPTKPEVACERLLDSFDAQPARKRRISATMLVRTLRAARPQLSQLRCASAVPQTSPDATLKETLTAQIPQKQEELKQLKADHGSKVLGEVTVDQCIGGGRGVRCMLWETSLLDAAEGIRFRGYTIPECQELLPTFKGPAGDGEPTPEAILWLLLTGEIPTKEQCDGLTAELFERSALPAHATQLLDSLPKTMHPMTQFSLGLQAYCCSVQVDLVRPCSFASTASARIRHESHRWRARRRRRDRARIGSVRARAR